MSLATSGQIKKGGLSNALTTLREFAMDYGDPVFKENAALAISREIPGISNTKIRVLTEQNVAKIRQGERDFLSKLSFFSRFLRRLQSPAFETAYGNKGGSYA